MTRIYLIRHGQASFSADNYDNLSPLGIEQSQLLGHYLADKNITPDVIISGSMLRHQQTAYHSLAALANKHKNVIHAKVEDPRWNEYDHQNILANYNPSFTTPMAVRQHFGQQQNSRLAFQKSFVAAIEKWTNTSQQGSYSETWSQFSTRVIGALNEVAQKYQGQTILVYTSGGPISLVTSLLLGLPLTDFIRVNLSLVNAGVTKIVARGEFKDLMLSSFNEHHIFEQQHKKLISYT